MDMDEKAVVSVEKQQKKIKIMSTILLLLGLGLCWIPVVGAGLCVFS